MINKHLLSLVAEFYAISLKGIYVFTSQEPSCILNQVLMPPTQATCWLLLDPQIQLDRPFLAKKLYSISCFDQDFVFFVIITSTHTHSFLVQSRYQRID